MARFALQLHGGIQASAVPLPQLLKKQPGVVVAGWEVVLHGCRLRAGGWRKRRERSDLLRVFVCRRMPTNTTAHDKMGSGALLCQDCPPGPSLRGPSCFPNTNHSWERVNLPGSTPFYRLRTLRPCRDSLKMSPVGSKVFFSSSSQSITLSRLLHHHLSPALQKKDIGTRTLHEEPPPPPTTSPAVGQLSSTAPTGLVWVSSTLRRSRFPRVPLRSV